MTVSEPQIPPSDIQWSEDLPQFKSTGLLLPVDEDYPHRLDTLYGEDISFGFVSGDMDNITEYHNGIVSFNIGRKHGSKLVQLASEATITFYHARQIFPLHRQSERRGLLITAQALPVQELEVFAGSLMNILALRAEPRNQNSKE